MQQPDRIDRRDDRDAESVLIEAAREGDRDAFARLYRAHVGRVYGLCLRMTADVETAETLTQDVFVRAWRKLDRFEGRSRFGTWLHRLTVNLITDHRRSRKLRESREVPGEEAETPVAVAGRAANGERIDLERAIAQLPPGARTVFVLHDVEGYLHREIAEATGLAVGTVKAQLHRARKLLREALS